jgi:hypothetical protein
MNLIYKYLISILNINLEFPISPSLNITSFLLTKITFDYRIIFILLNGDFFKKNFVFFNISIIFL